MSETDSRGVIHHITKKRLKFQRLEQKGGESCFYEYTSEVFLVLWKHITKANIKVETPIKPQLFFRHSHSSISLPYLTKKKPMFY
jgi:hypothetical protein